ncbi:S9 family peptidase [Vibrio owensii]|uniref:Prolyl oligopeptidase family serine peptidase n=1 Tax=Vibrio owensii TaxID=696485 RepID=A0AAP9GEI6_9VIBR|nr:MULTISPECIES: S9 family peptidase [Vibrio harveyi group]APX07562.1 S9 family peptidase [Vibrio campbellii]AQM68313.1 Prolyl tripeptidyl peptidase precursor [Vibrio campbellii]ARR07797.1 peptidase S9 [Vibrio campbellii]ARR45785.1 S9 family peptidase [Vibrio campbellii]AYO15935.1 S9 family peptidase [Vibrio owensii]
MKKRTLLAVTAALVGSVHSAPIAAQDKQSAILQSAELFAKSSAYFNPKISPDGKHLAFESSIDGKDALVILDSKTMQPSSVLRFSGNEQVGDYYWVNNERVVASKEYLKSWSTAPRYYGELVSANVDGNKYAYIFGYNPPQTSRLVRASSIVRAYGDVLDILPEDDRHILVSALPFGEYSFNLEAPREVYRVNVYTGRRSKITTAPIPFSRFLTDHDGEVRFVSGLNSNNKVELYYRVNDQWKSSDKLAALKNFEEFYPISFAENQDSVYAAISQSGEPRAIHHLNLKTGKSTKVASDDTVDPKEYWLDPDSKQLYAVEFESDYPTYAFVDPKNKRSEYLKQILTSLPGHQVRLVSETEAGDAYVIMAFNDRNPGDYYLFTTEPKEIRYLFSAREWLDPEKMAEVKPFEFTSRDGKTISGYLTLPPNTEAKNLPLIVNPHGGPHGPRDWWRFTEENQFLANNGYAVMQVNFRGSGGFGKQFEEAGYRKWGTNIQYDIIDATKHIVAEGIADKERICISGGSFGGYSALQSATLAPELFQCAVGSAGVYDLELMFTEGDVPDSRMGLSFLKEVLGTDPKVWKAMSPTHNADKLKASILLVHGGKDQRAPIEHYEAMAKALDKLNYPYESFVLDDEGHGFYKDEHRAKYYAHVLGFFDKHLKN